MRRAYRPTCREVVVVHREAGNPRPSTSPRPAPTVLAMMLRAEAFDATLAGLGSRPDELTFHELLAAYGEPTRRYHDATHVDACLAALADNADLAEHVHEVEIAVWFHDAIYDARRGDNEERSAEWAVRFLAANGLEQEALERVRALIMATKHVATPATADERLLVDIDLGILGQSPTVFCRYDEAIREEYAWVPEPQYRAGRIAVLDSFLRRPSIYLTPRFRELYEASARRNLHGAIARLAATDRPA